MRARTSCAAAALVPLLVVDAFATMACAGPRRPALATTVARQSGLRDFAFSPAAGNGERLISWTAAGRFEDVGRLVERLGEPFPDGCSLSLSMKTTAQSVDRVVLAVAGTIAPGRRDAGHQPCAGWPTLARTFEEIATAIPRRSWLTELAQRGDVVALAGLTAGGEEDVSAFVRALAASTSGVGGVSTAPEEMSGRTVMRFHVEIHLRD